MYPVAISRKISLCRIFWGGFFRYGVLFVRFAGILSAYGLALADVVHEAQEPCARVYDKGKLIMRKVINSNFSNNSFSFFRFPIFFVLGPWSYCLNTELHISDFWMIGFNGFQVKTLFSLFTGSFSYLDERIDHLTQKCVEELKSQGFEK